MVYHAIILAMVHTLLKPDVGVPSKTCAVVQGLTIACRVSTEDACFKALLKMEELTMALLLAHRYAIA